MTDGRSDRLHAGAARTGAREPEEVPLGADAVHSAGSGPSARSPRRRSTSATRSAASTGRARRSIPKPRPSTGRRTTRPSRRRGFTRGSTSINGETRKRRRRTAFRSGKPNRSVRRLAIEAGGRGGALAGRGRRRRPWSFNCPPEQPPATPGERRQHRRLPAAPAGRGGGLTTGTRRAAVREAAVRCAHGNRSEQAARSSSRCRTATRRTTSAPLWSGSASTIPRRPARAAASA